ncbi:MAG TPA: hypothetical protein DCR40_17265 [Prolixibacteraceae bacterium]|nr:hypothetical protein [Prolixibacteraceae bacterium]
MLFQRQEKTVYKHANKYQNIKNKPLKSHKKYSIINNHFQSQLFGLLFAQQIRTTGRKINKII